jgi:hypothetical protein
VPPVPKEEIARYWALLDAAIIHLRRTPLFETVIPSKIFEAMGMGVPLLMGVKGEAAGAGIVEAERREFASPLRMQRRWWKSCLFSKTIPASAGSLPQTPSPPLQSTAEPSSQPAC